jgi:hypothetical protein
MTAELSNACRQLDKARQIIAADLQEKDEGSCIVVES